jgi:hypothetical protein
MRAGSKEKKKRCPLCKKEYSEEYNYCRSDGQRLEIIEAEQGAQMPSSPGEEYDMVIATLFSYGDRVPGNQTFEVHIRRIAPG